MPPEPPVPASTTPVRDYLDRSAPGATPEFLVVPRSLAQSMPLRWQQVFVGLLADLHDAYGDLPWPEYAVVPSRWELLTDLDETQSIKGVRVIALSEHVDYWNHLGWKDPFSSGEFSRRQAEYVRVLGTRDSYTPQMIVDGRIGFVGSDDRKARRAE